VNVKVVSLRKSQVSREPVIIDVRAYPTALAEIQEILGSEDNLRNIRLINRRYREMISSFLDGKSNVYELKKRLVRLNEEFESEEEKTIFSKNILFFVVEVEEDIKLLEKILQNLEKFYSSDISTTKIIQEIVKNSVKEVRQFQKVSRMFSNMLQNRLDELLSAMEAYRKISTENIHMRMYISKKLIDLSKEYTKIYRAYKELQVLKLSANLGLTRTRSILLRLVQYSERLKELKTRLLLGEITEEEFSKDYSQLTSEIYMLQNYLSEELKSLQIFEKYFTEKGTQITKILGEEIFENIQSIFIFSRKSAKIISKYYLSQDFSV
jgi:hypothetical protein